MAHVSLALKCCLKSLDHYYIVMNGLSLQACCCNNEQCPPGWFCGRRRGPEGAADSSWNPRGHEGRGREDRTHDRRRGDGDPEVRHDKATQSDLHSSFLSRFSVLYAVAPRCLNGPSSTYESHLEQGVKPHSAFIAYNLNHKM